MEVRFWLKLPKRTHAWMSGCIYFQSSRLAYLHVCIEKADITGHHQWSESYCVFPDEEEGLEYGCCFLLFCRLSSPLSDVSKGTPVHTKRRLTQTFLSYKWLSLHIFLK